MKIFKSISSIQKYLSTQSQIAFVPTMGNLHQGHLSLIRKAKKPKTCIVVSIFVNRLQFNDKKDFASYPKTLKQDLEYLKNECVDAVFIPTEQEMNTNHSEFKLSFFNLEYQLCDAFRPGHFEGVITIVMKLCNIIQPHYLFFPKIREVEFGLHCNRFLLSICKSDRYHPLPVKLWTIKRHPATNLNRG